MEVMLYNERKSELKAEKIMVIPMRMRNRMRLLESFLRFIRFFSEFNCASDISISFA